MSPVNLKKFRKPNALVMFELKDKRSPLKSTFARVGQTWFHIIHLNAAGEVLVGHKVNIENERNFFLSKGATETKLNPCGEGYRKPADQITDRQLRRRANACVDQRTMKRCGFCGSNENMRVHHLDGDESNYDEVNLIGACHACNGQIGFLLKRHNIGRRVDLKYNPPAKPARNLAQWVMAVKSLRGESTDMTPRQAIATIHATTPNMRSYFAEQIWKLRRARGTDTTRAPF